MQVSRSDLTITKEYNNKLLFHTLFTLHILNPGLTLALRIALGYPGL